ncbi:hypothetical protein B0H12DRAFT_1310408 [Mycena haematopus]|nr:hypothetical protein B0H12DRAFT_1310408 [Mycena haematopus]
MTLEEIQPSAPGLNTKPLLPVFPSDIPPVYHQYRKKSVNDERQYRRDDEESEMKPSSGAGPQLSAWEEPKNQAHPHTRSTQRSLCAAHIKVAFLVVLGKGGEADEEEVREGAVVGATDVPAVGLVGVKAGSKGKELFRRPLRSTNRSLGLRRRRPDLCTNQSFARTPPQGLRPSSELRDRVPCLAAIVLVEGEAWRDHSISERRLSFAPYRHELRSLPPRASLPTVLELRSHFSCTHPPLPFPQNCRSWKDNHS